MPIDTWKNTFNHKGTMLLRYKHTHHVLGLALFMTLLMVSFVPSGIANAQSECVEDDIPMNYSLYAEDFKNESFDTALPYLRWILKCAPGFPTNSDRNYERAVKAYEGIAMASDDADFRRTYLDSALVMYDTSPALLDESGLEYDAFEWIFNKGRFIQTHAEHLPDLQTVVGAVYLDAYNLDHTRLQNYYVNYIILDMVNKDNKSDAVDFMDRVEVDFADDADVMATLENWRGQLFTSPDERIAFLESQIEKKPDDDELKAELLQLYMDEGYRDLAYEMAESVMNASPTPRLYRTVGKMRLDDGDTDEAIRLYEESLAMDGGVEAAREVYFNIGIAHQQDGRLASARAQFNRSVQADPSYVQALIAIGDLYVTAVQGCGSFEREDRAVYWLAADYFDRAASRAEIPALQNQARQRTSSIRRYFPTAEDKFFKNWNPGDRFTIDYGCYTWIGESTTVR